MSDEYHSTGPAVGPAAAVLRCAHLCVASPWSFHFGASRVEALAARAAERGIGALGMCDRNGLWGAVPFQRACEAAGVEPLIGVRLRVEGVEAQLLALDESGYAALCRLSTQLQFAHAETEESGIGRSRRLQEWLLAECGGGYAVLSRDRELLQALRAARGPQELFVAVRPAPAGGSDLALAKELALPPVAAPLVAFADPPRADGRHPGWERHRLLVAIGSNANLSRLDGRRLAPRDAWLKGPRELAQDYRHALECVRNAAELAQRCAFRIPLGARRLPRFPVPGGRPPQAHLARLCERGWRRRRVPGEPRYRDQLRKELALIEELSLADYFLIVADIVRWARSQGLQSCGRGSAANSLVSYLLGLTHVDPIRHNLYFERFLNRGRSDLPDVDLDFAWDERDLVLDYVYRRYGRERVAMISTHATFGARGAVRELAKAAGVPAAEIAEVTRALPAFHDGPVDAASLRRTPSCARLPLDAEPWRTILEEAAALQGFPRHLGIHVGGVVIAPSPLTDHLPLQHAAKEIGAERVVVTQWDMVPVEDAGLLKIDLLGNRGLAVVRDAVAEVARNTGLRLDFAQLDPQQDSRTCDLLERGDTMGCFYIESPSMRGLLQKLRCRDFGALVAASSIIRPGIASSGMMRAYVERFHRVRETGRHDDSWYLHPALRELLGETYGVMAYQEDALRVAERLAGMSPEDADGLRRAMTKKRGFQSMQRWRKRFLAGACRGGLARAAAEELWRQMDSFSGYSFCKAHSASYAEVSFRSAYLRAHFPAEFMGAVLRNGGGYYSTFAYLAEARRMGLKLLPPCVNASGSTFAGRGGAVRVGLSQVRGVHGETVRRILAERAARGPFASFEDFATRVRPEPAELEALARAGALDALPDGMNRPERLRAAALWARNGFWRRPPPAPDYGRRELLRQEHEALGFLVSAHPLELYPGAAQAAGALPASELHRHVNRRVRLVGWQVTSKPVQTRGGEPMVFVSFEDTTALYETVLFPQAYRRLAPWILTQGPYLLDGVVREEFGALTVEVSDLRLLEPQATSREAPSRQAGARPAKPARS